MNKLKKLAKFREVLSNYCPDNKLVNEIQDVKLIFLTGPSASGRNTIISHLVKTGKYHFVVSDTTREPRVNDGVPEVNGINYWYKTEQQFLDGLNEGRYIEAAIIHEQQVSGISFSELLKAKELNQYAIDDIEPQGVDNIMRMKPNTKPIFVIPPSFKEWRSRIQRRGELPIAEIERRTRSMVFEIMQALRVDYYYFIVNDLLDDAVIEIRNYIEKSIIDKVAESKSREIAENLCKTAEKHLRGN